MNVLLLNDNATVPHIGCLAVADAHARMLGEMGHHVAARRFVDQCGELNRGDETSSIRAALEDARLRADLERTDAVVLNGEGSIHHGAGLHWLAILGAAQRLGKRTLLVNAVFQDSPGYDGVLRACDDLCVRDRRSVDGLASMGVRARLIPDSMFEAGFDDRPTIDLAGKVVVTDWHSQRNGDVGAAVRQFLGARGGECFYYPLMHGTHFGTWRSALANWRRARAVVTGRHHGVCLAAMARVPFVALPSNTHKIEGMLDAAGSDLGVCTGADGIAGTLSRVEADAAPCARVWEWAESARPLSVFRALGIGTGPTGGVGAAAELARLAQVATPPDWTRHPMWWEYGIAPNLRG